MGARNCTATLRVLLRRTTLFTPRAHLNTAWFLGYWIVPTYCAVPMDLLYFLQGPADDWVAWEYVPRGPTDACSDRWAMRDFVPSLQTLGILGSGTAP